MPAVVAARLPLPREPRLWAHLSVAALVLNTVPFLLIGYAEIHVSSAVAGVANGTAPLFTALFAFAALRDERPTARTAIGIVVGLAGAAVVLRVWDGVQADTAGVAMAIAAAACYGLGWVYLRRFVRDSGQSPLGSDHLSVGLLHGAAGRNLPRDVATGPHGCADDTGGRTRPRRSRHRSGLCTAAQHHSRRRRDSSLYRDILDSRCSRCSPVSSSSTKPWAGTSQERSSCFSARH